MAPQSKEWSIEVREGGSQEVMTENNLETMVSLLLKDEQQQQQQQQQHQHHQHQHQHQHYLSPPRPGTTTRTFFLPPPPGLAPSPSSCSSSSISSPGTRSPVLLMSNTSTCSNISSPGGGGEGVGVGIGSLMSQQDLTMPPVPPPSGEALDLMARLCLERVLGRPDAMARRTELGIALRDAMGPLYQKGWVNLALAELERKGHGRLTPDGVFFRASSPLMGALANMRLNDNTMPAAGAAHTAATYNTTSTGSSTAKVSSSRKRGFLLIDGGYYEWLQWHVLQGRTSSHAIDVRLLVQRLESLLGVSFVRRLYVQSTETGARGPFHKMLEAGAGFEVELHRVRDSPANRGVGVAIAAQIMTSTFKAGFDTLVVLTGGDSNLGPAFRAAQMENENRLCNRQHVQELVALGGMRMSPELFPFLYRPVDGSTFLVEGVMASCVVLKNELGRGGMTSSGLALSPSHQRNARSLSPPLIRKGGLPESACETIRSGAGGGVGVGGGGFPSPPSKGRSVSYSALHERAAAASVGAAHELGGSGGSGSGCGSTGTGSPRLGGSGGGGGSGAVGSGSRPRRWCNFGHRCKYFEDVQGNLSHFQRFAHVCKDDLQCPFVLNYAAHRMTEEGKAHFAMWKHSCPHGLDCQYFAQPDKHRRHIEFFTHKAKVLNAAAQQLQQQIPSPLLVHLGAHPAHGQVQHQHQHQQHQHLPHPHSHPQLQALSLSASGSAPALTPQSSAATQLPLPATLMETEQLLSRFVGDWDPEVVQQMLQQQQQQQQGVRRPPTVPENEMGAVGGPSSSQRSWSPQQSPNLW